MFYVKIFNKLTEEIKKIPARDYEDAFDKYTRIIYDGDGHSEMFEYKIEIVKDEDCFMHE